MPFLSRLLVDRDKRRLAREREKRKQRFKQYINRIGRKPMPWLHSQTKKYK
jgi:hypothetical protein